MSTTLKFLAPTVLLLVGMLSATADEAWFPKAVKASLVFRDDVSGANGYPHVLKVFLRLDNAHDADVEWYANSVTGIEAELLDPTGKPVRQPPMAASVQSNPCFYRLPFGSRLDWLISHGGVTMAADAKDKYALVVGSQGWLVPMATAGSYTLRLRLRGWPGLSPVASVPKEFDAQGLKLLLDLPPANIKVEPSVEPGAGHPQDAPPVKAATPTQETKDDSR